MTIVGNKQLAHLPRCGVWGEDEGALEFIYSHALRSAVLFAGIDAQVFQFLLPWRKTGEICLRFPDIRYHKRQTER